MLQELRELRQPGEHMHIIFVGDKPSKRNLNQNIPFVGTRSYATLLSWIAKMDVSIQNIKIINSTDNLAEIDVKSYSVSGGAVIALGQNAEDYIKQIGITDYFRLPHPSGLNRQINDKTHLRNMLYECKKYIYSK
jgi:uracil-DNA glycosylase